MKTIARILLCIGISIFFSSHVAHAADFYVIPTTQTASVGKAVTVDVSVDTQKDSVNAVQATIHFSSDILEVKSIEYVDSPFSLWIQTPTYSNTNGTISFIGGAPNGIKGASIHVMHVHFVTKAVGLGKIQFIDGAISTADGTGRNVLVQHNGAEISVESVAGVTPRTPVISLVPAPSIISRTPVPAKGTPEAPRVSVPFYPRQTEWEDHRASFVASWVLPDDVTAVATVLDTHPHTDPALFKGLFDHQEFPAILDEGVYYLHVRFKNAKGLGPTTHYKISIDIRPPFDLRALWANGNKGTDPSPVIELDAADALSGIDRYQITVNNTSYTTSSPSFELPPLLPGHYSILVRAFDKAGNAIDASSEYTVLAITEPQILSYTDHIDLARGEKLSVFGIAPEGNRVAIAILKNSELVTRSSVSVDALTKTWKYISNYSFNSGDYTLQVTSIDKDNATSLPIKRLFKVLDRVIIQVLGIYITPTRLVVTIIIIMLVMPVIWPELFNKMAAVIKKRYVVNAIRNLVYKPSRKPKNIKPSKK